MSIFLNTRIDIVKLSTEEKPTVNLKNGSTLYEVDTAKLYVWYKDNWYDEEGNAVEETENTETNDPNRSVKLDETENTENTETNDPNRSVKLDETEDVKEVGKVVMEDDNK